MEKAALPWRDWSHRGHEAMRQQHRFSAKKFRNPGLAGSQHTGGEFQGTVSPRRITVY